VIHQAAASISDSALYPSVNLRGPILSREGKEGTGRREKKDREGGEGGKGKEGEENWRERIKGGKEKRGRKEFSFAVPSPRSDSGCATDLIVTHSITDETKKKGWKTGSFKLDPQ